MFIQHKHVLDLLEFLIYLFGVHFPQLHYYGVWYLLDSAKMRCLTYHGQMQGTKVVDESHDQDNTDLHKCVIYIRDFTPDLDESTVSYI